MANDITVDVQFPDDMLGKMKRRARSLQFHDLKFYVRWLIARDVAPDSQDADLVAALIFEGMNSGEAIPFDDKFKRELIARTDKIISDGAMKNRAAG